ncbi:MAG: flagellar hook-length control protein FliK [Eubacteriales bacterium]
MTSEVNAKVSSPVMDKIATSAKRSCTCARHNFGEEISKKTEMQVNTNSKDSVLKQDKDVKTVEKVEEVVENANQPQNLTEPSEKIENPEVISSMQVQQIAMNIVTVENKEDIPKIVLQEGFQAETQESEAVVQYAKFEGTTKSDKNTETEDADVVKFENLKQEGEKEPIAPQEQIAKKQEPKLEVKKNESEIKKSEEKVDQVSKQEQPKDFGIASNAVESRLDPSKVNVKVADVPVRAEAPDMPQQMIDKITYNVDKGKHVFDIELFPENLGKVGIKMVFEKGVAQLVMTTHTDKAHKLLSEQLDVIRSVLEANTRSETRVEVEAGENASENFDKDNFQGQSEKNQQEKQKDRQDEDVESFAQRLRLGIAG